MDFLDVRTAKGELIGKLSFDRDEEKFAFEYAPEWVASDNGYPLSPAINFEVPAKSSTVKRFIENLLPEGAGLEEIALSSSVSKTNTFALARIIGQECVGGLMLVPPGYDFKHKVYTPPRLVTDEELCTRIHERDRIPFSVWDKKVRLSIAGLQDKMPVLIDNGQMFLVEHPLASTHILKPVSRNPDLATIVANEHYCMSLANAVKVPAARTQIKRIPDPVLVIERFDRKFDPAQSTVDRLHVIDGCQLLDLSVAYKYERNFGDRPEVANIRDGASLKKLFACDVLADTPIQMTYQLMRWTLFQYLVGNADAHGKNLSFHVHPKGKITFAKTYDIVSTLIYPYESTMAMSIGDEFNFDDIRAYQWVLFADECGIPYKLLAGEMRDMANRATKAINDSAVDISSFTDAEKRDVARIQDFVRQQCAALIRDAKLVNSGLLGIGGHENNSELKP
jgi:serine/threonine-protein kinase HipA